MQRQCNLVCCGDERRVEHGLVSISIPVYHHLCVKAKAFPDFIRQRSLIVLGGVEKHRGSGGFSIVP